jgi:hypothetical protein
MFKLKPNIEITRGNGRMGMGSVLNADQCFGKCCPEVKFHRAMKHDEDCGGRRCDASVDAAAQKKR